MKDVKIKALFDEAFEDEIELLIRKRIRFRLKQVENAKVVHDIHMEVDKLLADLGIRKENGS